jgi:TRAP-type C4-dicarboxylate transport system permease small subunit
VPNLNKKTNGHKAESVLADGVINLPESEFPRFDKFKVFVGKVANGTSWISFAGMLIMVFLVMADIFYRLFANQTIYGVYDWVCFMMIPVGFFALGISTWRGEQVTVTILTDHMPKLINKILELFNFVCSAILVIIFVWRNIVQAGVVHQMGTKAIQFPLHTFWFYYVIAAGYCVFLFVIIMQLIGHILKWRVNK